MLHIHSIQHQRVKTIRLLAVLYSCEHSPRYNKDGGYMRIRVQERIFGDKGKGQQEPPNDNK